MNFILIDFLSVVKRSGLSLLRQVMRNKQLRSGATLDTLPPATTLLHELWGGYHAVTKARRMTGNGSQCKVG